MNRQDILDHRKKTLEMMKVFARRVDVMKTLTVGDTVYIEDTYGYEMEYFPQKILEIDLELGKMKVYEKSIDKTRWIDGFHIKEDNKFVWIQ